MVTVLGFVLVISYPVGATPVREYVPMFKPVNANSPAVAFMVVFPSDRIPLPPLPAYACSPGDAKRHLHPPKHDV